MKINKKILIPVFATAMGLSLIGGVGGAVAWYQFNTKVTASWIGVTTADGGVLQISSDDGSTWNSFADFGSATTKLHPITFGKMEANAALPSTAKKHPEAGVIDPDEWDNATSGTDYYQYTFKLQAKKYNSSTHTYDNCAATVKFADLHLGVSEADTTAGKDAVAKALRVHIAVGSTYKLVSLDGGTTNVYGALDLDRSGSADKVNNYQWETGHNTDIIYGVNATVGATPTQSSVSASSLVNTELVEVPVAGIDVTFTIWLEGWQKLHGAETAIWDITKDDGVGVQFGMKLSTDESTFVND